MRELDGSEAGGQFLRTALSLAAVENEPVRLVNVRGERPDPGLANQHLAVVETLAAVCDADVDGAELGSETVEFEPAVPEGIAGGDYRVDVGTAGSLTLLFDALCPLATRLEGPLSVTATGGTDVTWSPPADYHRRVKLPLCRRFGLRAAVDAERRGFYPEGGGRATLSLAPSELEPVEMTGSEAEDEMTGSEAEEAEEAGARDSNSNSDPNSGGVHVYSTESASLADREVARRQAEGALERLAPDRRGLAVGERVERTVESDCPGSAIVLRVERPGAVGGFSALGEPGTLAERVGEDAADAARRWLDTDAPVDRHLGDQLLLPLALAGGRIRIPATTDHVESSLDLLERFGVAVDREPGPTIVVPERESLLA